MILQKNYLDLKIIINSGFSKNDFTKMKLIFENISANIFNN